MEKPILHVREARRLRSIRQSCFRKKGGLVPQAALSKVRCCDRVKRGFFANPVTKIEAKQTSSRPVSHTSGRRHSSDTTAVSTHTTSLLAIECCTPRGGFRLHETFIVKSSQDSRVENLDVTEKSSRSRGRDIPVAIAKVGEFREGIFHRQREKR